MANAKFKFYGIDEDGKEKLLITENHPKLDASTADLKEALNGVSDLLGYDADRVVLNSDTTVAVAS